MNHTRIKGSYSSSSSCQYTISSIYAINSTIALTPIWEDQSEDTESKEKITFRTEMYQNQSWKQYSLRTIMWIAQTQFLPSVPPQGQPFFFLTPVSFYWRGEGEAFLWPITRLPKTQWALAPLSNGLKHKLMVLSTRSQQRLPTWSIPAR